MSEAALRNVEKELPKLQAELEKMKEAVPKSEALARLVQHIAATPEPLYHAGPNPWQKPAAQPCCNPRTTPQPQSIMATTAVPLPPPSEEVEAIVKNALSACIPPETGFTARKVNEWVDATADACLRGLAAMSLPYKYAVACTLTQRTGSGIATASTAYWDPRRDTSQVVVWENEQLQCLVTVHALCLDIVAATAGMATAADPMAAGGEAK